MAVVSASSSRRELRCYIEGEVFDDETLSGCVLNPFRTQNHSREVVRV